MAPFYQLIDLSSGNVVGDYDTEAEALVDLGQSALTHGWNSIRDYSLMQIDGDTQTVIALQQSLELLVRRQQLMSTEKLIKTVA